ncbi:glutamate 5-kinase [Sporosarcina sp. HYO08]|uniref:glutamate 5-kinase n=1 Tax=Sporosarcina sp. HYO08 TaxID=1759557 RepID=UPI0007936065|nr:glutamate 5-kinase [Sporosarcina sp. HYO08]KXH81959.1 glutamate 5-kinase [Sporosarcina sp. HYO08]
MRKQRIVVKIGSSSLTNDVGEIDQEKFDDHVGALVQLRENGHEVIVVSSGAVAAGFAGLGYPARPLTIKGKQAAAAVGQGILIQSYRERLGQHGIIPAQILLTRDDFSDRDRYKNAFATLTELLARGILPIINENDTVAVDELTFGDNDMLSALVGGFLHADQLIILTDINGLYDANPRTHPTAKRFDYLEEITDEQLSGADENGSSVGTGGMKSKILAAKTATSLGVAVFIGNGKGHEKLVEIAKGKGDGTYIAKAKLSKINTNRQWIYLHSESTGKLYVDEGAEKAILHNGKSLLPAGVYKIKGAFREGDVVEVFGRKGLLGKGEVQYSAEDLKAEMATRNRQAASVEVIHRDRWVKI